MSELRMLPAWLDAGANALSGSAPPAPTLEGALPGLARAQSLTPLQRLQRLQQSGPRRMRRCGRADPPRLAPVPARPRAFGPGDRRDLIRRALPRSGCRTRRQPVAPRRGRSDRGRPARQPRGGAAPAGGADRPRGGPPERRRLHPFARPDRHSPPAGEGAARLPAELLGGGAPRRCIAARPHAGDLVPDRDALRGSTRSRRASTRPRRVAADAPARDEPARPRRAEARRKPAAPDRRVGRWRGEVRGPGRPSSSSTTAWAGSCRSRRRTCRASPCLSRPRGSFRRRPP